MPNKGSTVEFYDGQNQFRVPFMMYADFKSILEPMQGPPLAGPSEPNPDPSEAYTTNVNQHNPSGWCVYSKFTYGKVDDPLKLYRGEDCVEKFCEHIKQEAYRLCHMFPEKTMETI